MPSETFIYQETAGFALKDKLPQDRYYYTAAGERVTTGSVIFIDERTRQDHKVDFSVARLAGLQDTTYAVANPSSDSSSLAALPGVPTGKVSLNEIQSTEALTQDSYVAAVAESSDPQLAVREAVTQAVQNVLQGGLLLKDGMTVEQAVDQILGKDK